MKAKYHLSLVNIVWLLYFIINFLFVDKYASRICEYSYILSITYLLSFTFLFWIFYKKVLPKISCPRTWLIGSFSVFCCILVCFQYAIDPYLIKVDRWSAIHNFLAGLLNGEYPYGQQTHLGGYGSPFPVWQILHLPFYALQNVGLSLFVVSGLFIWSISRIHNEKVALSAWFMLICSPGYWYEALVRSDLMTNLMVSCIITEWLIKKEIHLNKHLFLIGIISGLLLSTRLAAIIPLCVVYGYSFLLLPWKEKVLFLAVTLATFSLTFLPFLLWEGSTLLWFEYNPFILQTRQGSILSLLIFAILSTIIVYRQKYSLSKHLFICGGLLNLLVILAFIHSMWRNNTWLELYSSTFDISYFLMALPFYIWFNSVSSGGIRCGFRGE